jgi:hypothetical protein
MVFGGFDPGGVAAGDVNADGKPDIAVTFGLSVGILLNAGDGPRWRVATANHVAHFYRHAGPDDSDALVAMLQSSRLFESIEKKSAASHRNSGDVVAVSFPPIGLTPSATPPLEAHPDSYGHHGALNTHRELHTVLFASGFGVPRGHLGEISQMRIAPFVASLLGIMWSAEPPLSNAWRERDGTPLGTVFQAEVCLRTPW